MYKGVPNGTWSFGSDIFHSASWLRIQPCCGKHSSLILTIVCTVNVRLIPILCIRLLFGSGIVIHRAVWTLCYCMSFCECIYAVLLGISPELEFLVLGFFLLLLNICCHFNRFGNGGKNTLDQSQSFAWKPNAWFWLISIIYNPILIILFPLLNFMGTRMRKLWVQHCLKNNNP